MNQLPEAFKGHDLTGWTEYESKGVSGVARMTRRCVTVFIAVTENNEPGFGFMDFDDYEAGNWQYKPLTECFAEADKLACADNGWATAPIGSDPGWQDISTLPAEMKESQECFFGFAPVIPGFEVRAVMKFDGNDFVVVNFGAEWDTLCEPTHWRSLPAPPEAKQ